MKKAQTKFFACAFIAFRKLNKAVDEIFQILLLATC